MLEKILMKFKFTKKLIKKNNSLEEHNLILKQELEQMNQNHIEGLKKFEAEKKKAEKATALAALLIAEPHFMYISKKQNYIVLDQNELDKYKDTKLEERKSFKSISFYVKN